MSSNFVSVCRDVLAGAGTVGVAAPAAAAGAGEGEQIHRNVEGLKI